MANYKRILKCGCEVEFRYNDVIKDAAKIVYCPKHKAAPELYEALKIAESALNLYSGLHPSDKILSKQCEIADKALAKAEGK